MKNKLHLICILLITSYANSQIISFPNVYFKNKLLSSSSSNSIATNLSGVNFKIDSNNDGEIQYAEAEQVKELRIGYDSSLISIEGILFFTNLENLQVPFTNLYDINVSGLTHLKTLYCSNCSYLSNVNVANCTALETLGMTSQFITTLDVSTCTNLKELIVISSHLTTLDLSNNHLLTKLNCAACRFLTTLNIKNSSTETDLSFSECVLLQTVCCDPTDVSFVYNRMVGAALLQNYTVTSTCASLSNNNFAMNDDYLIYPNPTKGFLNIKSNNFSETDYSFSLIDLQGKIVLNKQFKNADLTESIPLVGLPKGMYLAVLQTTDKKITKKIILE